MPESAFALLRELHDGLPAVAHVGMLVPWANTMVETELPRLGLDKVVWHYARLMPDDQSTTLDDGFLTGLIRAMPVALKQLSRLPVSTVYLACTAAGFTFPAVSEYGTGQHDWPTVVTAFEALVTTLRQLTVRRVVLLTPYPARLTEREAQALVDCGISVLEHGSLGWADGFADARSEDVTALLDAMRPSALSAADAAVLSCTGWPTLDLINKLELRLARPVISSTVAMAIAALGAVSTIGEL